MRDTSIKYWDNSFWPEAMFSKTSYSNFVFSKHFHDYYTLILIEQGVNEGFTEKENYLAGTDSVLIINPGELHAGSAYQKKPLSFKAFRFEEKFLKRLNNDFEIDISSDIYFNNTPFYNKELKDKLKQFFRQSEESYNRLNLECLKLEIFKILIDEYTCSTKFSNYSSENKQKHTKKAIAYLNDNYCENFNLAQLAENCDISPYHLIRIFRKEFNQTPFEYLKNLRIEKSKKLLQSQASITEVALQLGFYDTSHFTRNFINNEGISPLKFRN